MKNTSLKPNWQILSNRPTWGYISTVELAKVLGVSPQTINNWLLRGKLPLPASEAHPYIKGNKNFWSISSLRSFLEGKSEDEIHLEWIKTHLPNDNFKTIGQAQFLVKNCYKLLGFERA